MTMNSRDTAPADVFDSTQPAPVGRPRLWGAVPIGRCWNKVAWAYVAYWLSPREEFRNDLIAAIDDARTAFIAFSPSESGGGAASNLAEWRNSLSFSSQVDFESLEEAKQRASEQSEISEILAFWEYWGAAAPRFCQVKKDELLNFLSREERKGFLLGEQVDRAIRPEPDASRFLRFETVSRPAECADIPFGSNPFGLIESERHIVVAPSLDLSGFTHVWADRVEIFASELGIKAPNVREMAYEANVPEAKQKAIDEIFNQIARQMLGVEYGSAQPIGSSGHESKCSSPAFQDRDLTAGFACRTQEIVKDTETYVPIGSLPQPGAEVNSGSAASNTQSSRVSVRNRRILLDGKSDRDAPDRQPISKSTGIRRGTGSSIPNRRFWQRN
jgi:hypothetical protein